MGALARRAEGLANSALAKVRRHASYRVVRTQYEEIVVGDKRPDWRRYVAPGTTIAGCDIAESVLRVQIGRGTGELEVECSLAGDAWSSAAHAPSESVDTTVAQPATDRRRERGLFKATRPRESEADRRLADARAHARRLRCSPHPITSTSLVSFL